MNFHPTSSTTAARLRLGAFVAVPVLAFSVACVGGDDTSGTRGHDQVATVPEGTATAQDKDADKPTASESARPAGKSAFFDAQMTFVQCMRAKGGYKDYPDPKLSGYLDWSKVNEIGEQPGRNEGIKAGKDNVCADELQAAIAAEPKRDQQREYESMLAHAQCMRDNGLSGFTNPVLSGGGVVPGGDPSPGSPVFDPASPAYKQAREACKSKLLDGLDGMQ